MDTIFAQATAPGKAGVAIIRVSGPDAFEACSRLTGSIPSARMASLRKIRDFAGDTLDTALVIAFPDGASFTGEPVVEFQLHGSVAVVRSVLAELSRIPGFREAEPGEFTRRALENQRLDLTQVEGLADLVDAETDLQRRQAQAVMTGELSNRVQSWRRNLIDAGALLTVTLDFADEEVPVDVMPDVQALLRDVLVGLRDQLGGADAAERIRDGFEVAIMGPPNAGKSTLLNTIAKRQVALTSSIAGTTRDVLEVRIDLRGIPVTFLDTAGLRETADPLESAGIDLARSRSRDSDLRIWLSLGSEEIPATVEVVVPGHDDDGVRSGVSGKTGQGVSELLDRVHSVLSQRITPDRLAIRDRHRRAMQQASTRLDRSLRMIEGQVDVELVAEEISLASMALGEMIGVVDVEDLLDAIFSRFCIGK